MMLQAVPPHDLIPLMGMVTGIITTGLFVLVVIKVAQSQIGQALARRIHGKGGPGEQELRDEMHELRDVVSQLEERLAESEERLDFTERLLARHDQSEGLPGGRLLDH